MNSIIKIVQPVGDLFPDGDLHYHKKEKEQFCEKVSKLVEDGAEIVLIDLTYVTFIGEFGLNALLTARKIVLEAKGQIVICCIEGDLKNVLEMLGLDQVFKTFADVDDACKELNNPV